jgi:hypothetical protein
VRGVRPRARLKRWHERKRDLLCAGIRGLGWVAIATLAIARTATSPEAKASGSVTFFSNAINFLLTLQGEIAEVTFESPTT